jgi:hypothetical protein
MESLLAISGKDSTEILETKEKDIRQLNIKLGVQQKRRNVRL